MRITVRIKIRYLCFNNARSIFRYTEIATHGGKLEMLLSADILYQWTPCFECLNKVFDPYHLAVYSTTKDTGKRRTVVFGHLFQTHSSSFQSGQYNVNISFPPWLLFTACLQASGSFFPSSFFLYLKCALDITV